MSDQKRDNKIREALGKLNPDADALWTEDGLPTLDAVKDRTGFEVSREEVTAAAPKFTRKTPDASAPAPKAEDPADKPEPEAPAAEPEVKDERSEADFDALIAQAEADIAAAQAAKDKAADDRVKAENRHLELVREKSALYPAPNQAQATQAWVQSQQAERARRYGRVSEILQATKGDPSVLDPRTPVERAMARPTGHGVGRPNHGGAGPANANTGGG